MNGIIPYELAEGMEASRRAIESVKPGMKVAVFIGPEGGFDLSEVEKQLMQACSQYRLAEEF